LFNRNISTKNTKFIRIDVKDFYLSTELDDYEYMRIKQNYFFKEVIDEYNLKELVNDGWVHMEIRKGMYGLS